MSDFLINIHRRVLRILTPFETPPFFLPYPPPAQPTPYLLHITDLTIHFHPQRNTHVMYDWFSCIYLASLRFRYISDRMEFHQKSPSIPSFATTHPPPFFSPHPARKIHPHGNFMLPPSPPSTENFHSFMSFNRFPRERFVSFLGLASRVDWVEQPVG